MYESKEERDALFGHMQKYSELKLLNAVATGFGWAVLVSDNFENNRLKVIKLPNRAETTQELLNEAKILSQISQYLRHPNLIELGSVECYKIHWLGEEQQRWFIVLQYGGDNLRKRLGRLGIRNGGNGIDEYVYMNGSPLDLDEALDLAIQVTDGLRALHEFEEAPGQHIVHRDIKPENILVDDRGRARLTDFGISKVVAKLSQSITVAGTLPYIAPEYSTGRLTASCDIYSLGIVLYEMFTGTFPFSRFDDRFFTAPRPLHEVNSKVPRFVSDVVLKTLAYDRDKPRNEDADRYQRAADLLEDLRRCQSRLHPVPKQFEKLVKDDPQSKLYQDTRAHEQVRIFLFETDRPLACLGRLDATTRLDLPRVTRLNQTFHTDEAVGVVVPLPAGARPVAIPRSTPEEQLATVPPRGVTPVEFPAEAFELPTTDALPNRPEGKQAYDFAARIVELCRQVQELHRRGIYHGFLCHETVTWRQDGWHIDHVWLGALVGACKPDSVFGQSGIPPSDIAPDILRWDAPPTLACDIYGIGAILFRTLTGQGPLDNEAALAMTRGQAVPPFRASMAVPELAPRVARRLQRVVIQALQIEPARRYLSLDDMIDDLRRCRWPEDMVASLIEDAFELQRQGKNVEAYDTLDRALTFEPGSPAVHQARAEIYFLEGELSWAIKENEVALGIEQTGPACALQAQCLLAQKELDDATKYARRAVLLDDSARSHYILARCLEQSGQSHEAITEYEQAVEMAQVQRGTAVNVAAIQSELQALRSRLGDGAAPAASPAVS